MSIILANFGKYAISDYPFIGLLIRLNFTREKLHEPISAIAVFPAQNQTI